MKKFIKNAVALMLVLVFSASVAMSVTVDAAEWHVYDDAGLLTEDQYYELEDMLATISNNRGVDVAIVTTSEPYSGSDIRVFAADYYEAYGFGNDGVEFFVDTAARDWALIGHGFGETAFNSDARSYMSDIIVDYLHDDDYYSAFMQYASLADDMIAMARDGKPYKKPFGFALAIVIAIGIGVVLALIMASAEKSKLKSVRFEPEAANYIKDGSMNVTYSKDFYMYSTVTRSARPKESKSGSFSSSSGGSYSGSSGKY